MRCEHDGCTAAATSVAQDHAAAAAGRYDETTMTFVCSDHLAALRPCLVLPLDEDVTT